MKRKKHNHAGNCWDHAYECPHCNTMDQAVLCDVCHKHCEPRGECEECALCKICNEDALLEKAMQEGLN